MHGTLQWCACLDSISPSSFATISFRSILELALCLIGAAFSPTFSSGHHQAHILLNLVPCLSVFGLSFCSFNTSLRSIKPFSMLFMAHTKFSLYHASWRCLAARLAQQPRSMLPQLCIDRHLASRRSTFPSVNHTERVVIGQSSTTRREAPNPERAPSPLRRHIVCFLFLAPITSLVMCSQSWLEYSAVGSHMMNIDSWQEEEMFRMEHESDSVSLTGAVTEMPMTEPSPQPTSVPRYQPFFCSTLASGLSRLKKGIIMPNAVSPSWPVLSVSRGRVCILSRPPHRTCLWHWHECCDQCILRGSSYSAAVEPNQSEII